MPYYFNQFTNETVWEDPRRAQDREADAMLDAMAAAGGGGGVAATDGGDDRGADYSAPPDDDGGGGGGGGGGGADEWTEYADDDGVPYWYNSRTQASVWECPY